MAFPAPKITIFYHRKIEFTEKGSHARLVYPMNLKTYMLSFKLDESDFILCPCFIYDRSHIVKKDLMRYSANIFERSYKAFFNRI